DPSLERLNSYGVTFHSYTEPHLCADNEMVRGILLAVLATMAKQEAKRLSERVIAGMRKAAAKGHQERQSDWAASGRCRDGKSNSAASAGRHRHQQDGCDRRRRDCHRSAGPG